MEDQPNLWTFLLLQHLPTISECVQANVSVSLCYGLVKQQDTVKEFTLLLHHLWTKSFTYTYLDTFKTVKKKLMEHLKIYCNKVQKAGGNKHQNMIVWSRDNNKLLDLLNINADPEKFDKFEKNFYFDQKSLTRKIVLSNDIDVEYEEQVLQSQKIVQDDEEKLQNEMSFIFQDEHVPLENTDQSLNDH